MLWQGAGAGTGILGMNDHRVWVKFITDVSSSDGSVKYTKDSEWLVDAVTADVLLLAGAAVKIPWQLPD